MQERQITRTPRRKENGIIIIDSAHEKFEDGLFEFVKSV